MNKLMIAVLAGFMSLAVGAYAAEDTKKKDEPKKAPAPVAAPAPAPAPAADMKVDEPKKARRAARAAKG